MATAREEAAAIVRRKTTEYLAAQLQLEKYPDESFSQILSKEDINPIFVRRWQATCRRVAKANDPIFLPWRRFAELGTDEFRERAKDVIGELGEASAETVNPLVAQAFNSAARFHARRGPPVRQTLCGSRATMASALAQATRPRRRCPTLTLKRCGKCFTARNRRARCPTNRSSTLSGTSTRPRRKSLWKLQGEVDRWLIQSPQAPAYAVALVRSRR